MGKISYIQIKLLFFIFIVTLFSSCGGTGSSLNTFTGDSGGPNQSAFETVEPFDIPITIAKHSPPDATLISASTSTGAGEFLLKELSKNPPVSVPNIFPHEPLVTPVGDLQSGIDFTLPLQAINPSCERITITGAAGATDANATLRFYDSQRNNLIEITTEADGSFSQSFCTSLVGFGEAVALVTMENEAASYPVFVTVEDSILGLHPYNVRITNVTDMRNSLPAVASGCVAFTATDVNGNPFVVCNPSVAGGYLSTFTSDIASTLDQIQFCSDYSCLVGVDNQGRIIRVSGTDGTATVISDESLVGRNIRISPDDLYVATESQAAGGADRVYLVLEPLTLSVNQLTDSINVNEATMTADNLEFDWVDNDTLLAIRRYPVIGGDPLSGSHTVETYDFAVAFAGSDQNPTIVPVETLTPTINGLDYRNPHMSPVAASLDFIFECESNVDAGQFDLCLATVGAGPQTIIVNHTATRTSISHSNYTADGAFIAFQSTYSVGVEAIETYDTALTSTQILTLGENPNPSPADVNASVIAYQREDQTGQLQNHVLNLDLY